MHSLSDIIQESIAIKEALLADEALHQQLLLAAQAMARTFAQGGKVLFCGNGGSAADAQHLAAELSGKFYLDRSPLFAEALHVNSSYLTAVANDYDYEETFRRMVLAKGKAGDVLVCLSTSGNSANVVAAAETAKELGLTLIALTGAGGGKLAALSDYLLAVPSTDVPRIQENHIFIGHLLCEWVENDLFGPR